MVDPGTLMVSTEIPFHKCKSFSYIHALLNDSCYKHALYCYTTILNHLRALITTKCKQIMSLNNNMYVAKHVPWFIRLLEYQANEFQTIPILYCLFY